MWADTCAKSFILLTQCAHSTCYPFSSFVTLHHVFEQVVWLAATPNVSTSMWGFRGGMKGRDERKEPVTSLVTNHPDTQMRGVRWLNNVHVPPRPPTFRVFLWAPNGPAAWRCHQIASDWGWSHPSPLLVFHVGYISDRRVIKAAINV